jgi:hypothetical protein
VDGMEVEPDAVIGAHGEWQGRWCSEASAAGTTTMAGKWVGKGNGGVPAMVTKQLFCGRITWRLWVVFLFCRAYYMEGLSVSDEGKFCSDS